MTTTKTKLMPGPELDALVAERVMGWERCEGEAIPEDHRHRDEPLAGQVVWLKDGRRMACRLCGDLPDFSGSYTGPNDAWTVVEHLTADPHVWAVLERTFEPRGWSCKFGSSGGYARESAPTVQEAICRAALAWVSHQ